MEPGSTPLDHLLELTYHVEQRHFWFRGFRQFVRPLLAAAVANRPAPALLDCGCGTGANLVLLARFGRASGIDRSPVGVSCARRYGQTRVARADVTGLPFREATFDVVTSIDLLYALEDPAEEQAVAEMVRVLKPGGALILQVPALALLRGNHSILCHERRRYTPARVRGLLERAGLTIRRLTFTNALLFPLVLAVRLSQRLVGLRSPETAIQEITLPPAPVNLALTAVVSLEAVALRWINMPIGSSLLCLAHKPVTSTGAGPIE